MDQQSPFNQPPAVMSPPQHGELIPAPQSTWPTVIGIILIVVGSLGILMNVCGGVVSLFTPAMMNAVSQAGNQSDPMIQLQLDMARRFMVWNVMNTTMMAFLGVLVLVAGIGILRRRASGPKWAKVWAIARLIWAAIGAYATYVITQQTMQMLEQAAAESGDQIPPAAMGFMVALGPLAVIVNLIMWCAIPMFVLIWFARQSVKGEVANWS